MVSGLQTTCVRSTPAAPRGIHTFGYVAVCCVTPQCPWQFLSNESMLLVRRHDDAMGSVGDGGLPAWGMLLCGDQIGQDMGITRFQEGVAVLAVDRHFRLTD
jgi:hypothetical protein